MVARGAAGGKRNPKAATEVVILLSTSGRPRGLKEAAAVDHERRTGDETGAREVHDCVRDVVRCSTRPSRDSAARRSSCSGSTATGPGAIPHTRTSGASARANTFVSMESAAFAALCGANDGHGSSPITSSIMITTPPDSRR